MTDLPTRQLGNYRLIRLLGEGGFAEVYLAEHVYLKTYAAIKVLQTRLASEKQADFLTEARSIAHLKHFNIVRVLEFGVEGSIPFLVMDYAPEGTLRQHYPLNTRVPLADVLTYVKQVAAALQYAHNKHIIHRDIKPENILLGTRNKLLLSDFGIARVVESAFDQSSQEIIGTIMYMAPEQLQNKPCPASDQYALATVVYEWLSGDHLFHGSFAEIASQQLLAPPPPFHERGIDLAPDIEKAVLKALSKDPQQRFTNVQEFATALEQSYQVTPAVGTTLSSISTTQQNHSHSPANQAIRPFPEHQQIPDAIPQSANSQPSSRSHTSIGKIFLFIAAILLAIISSSGLTYYLMVFRPSSLQTAAQIKQATATAQANAQSITALQNLYIRTTRGKPALQSDLKANDANGWSEYDLKTFGSCIFKRGAYYASTIPGSSSNFGTPSFCNATNPNISFSNFAFQVEMTIIRGDAGGITFRSGDYFIIGKNGSYTFSISSFATTSGTILDVKSNPFIKVGLNQVNIIAAIIRGSHCYLYINKHYIAQASDNAPNYTGFSIGVGAQATTHTTEVAFRNMQIWKL